MISQLFSERMVLIIITLIGMAICSAGIGQVAARGEWLHPMAILGYALGVLVLGIVAATFFGVSLPLITTERAAIIAVVTIAIAKIALTQIHQVMR